MTPLVLLHGFLGCAADWTPWQEALADSRPVHAVDLPGHGADGAPVPADFAGLVDAVRARLDEAGLGRCDLVGYSLGGRLAYGLLAGAADRIRRFVAIGASPGLATDAERATRRAWDEGWARRLETEAFGDVLAAWAAQPLFEGLRASPAFAALAARRARGDPRRLAAALRAASPAGQPDHRPLLARTRVPGLLVAGADDGKYAALLRDLAGTNRALGFAAVPGAGHAPQLERPAATLALVRDFLDGRGRARGAL